jgi:hypothetical protein
LDCNGNQYEEQTLNEHLPSRRTFLLRFSNAAAPRVGNYRGRIEHIPTGRTARFTSLEGIDEFVQEILDDDEDGQYAGNNRVTQQ